MSLGSYSRSTDATDQIGKLLNTQRNLASVDAWYQKIINGNVNALRQGRRCDYDPNIPGVYYSLQPPGQQIRHFAMVQSNSSFEQSVFDRSFGEVIGGGSKTPGPSFVCFITISVVRQGILGPRIKLICAS